MFTDLRLSEFPVVIAVTLMAAATILGVPQADAQPACSGSPLVLTEMDLGSTDGLEIQNVSGAELDTTGWTVAISDTPYSDPDTVNPIVQTLPATMAAGEIIYWTDGAVNPWGNNMFWNPGDFPTFSGWAIILDDTGAIVDFAVWNGMPESDIASLSLSIGGHMVTIGDEWLSDGIVTGLDECGIGFSVQRQGNADHNDASDWTCLATNLGTQNPGLEVPFCSTINVGVDIKPGSYPNAINVRSKGKIPVAILTTDDFDASMVDASSVQFGPGGAQPVHYAIEDVDGDGDWDLLLHFNAQETGIACGDTEAMLTGQTIDGPPISIEGTDSVETVGCM